MSWLDTVPNAPLEFTTVKPQSAVMFTLHVVDNSGRNILHMLTAREYFYVNISSVHTVTQN